MLNEDLKDRIRNAYNALMQSKSLVPRWGQRQMIAAIARTLSRVGSKEGPAVCVVEAGTGTGKTIAYAVTCIPMAQALNKRLVVATATVALQEQFINKDLPDIAAHSGLEFSYALAKGRRRYVCLSKLDRLVVPGGDPVMSLALEDGVAPLATDAGPVYANMLDALARGEWDGDRDSWTDTIRDDIWFTATTDHAQCSGRRCPNIGQCSFFRARDRLGDADVIVTNHDLALADLALGGGAILPAPEDSIYVFDEGHHLPDKALNHFAAFCRLPSTQQWLEECDKALGQAAQPLAPMHTITRPLQALPQQLQQAAEGIAHVAGEIALLPQWSGVESSGEERQLRFAHGEVPGELVARAGALAAQFEGLAQGLQRIHEALEEALEGDSAGVASEDAETWHIQFGAMLSRAQGIAALWRDYAGGGEAAEPPIARWITERGSGELRGFDLRSSPILAADILNECLWSRAAGVVVTSATITALGSFDRFSDHAGVPEGSTLTVVPSPFDFASAVLRVPAMSCDPSDAEAHTAMLVEQLPQLLDADEGSLVLFSSRRQMLQVAEGLPGPWRARVLVQDEFSKQELLRQHRATIDGGAGSVIFGLASFAEGVDLPGDYCRHVVIAKIPFAVPDSPLEAALVEWVESRGGNAFMEVSVPAAGLRLVQASGRLLRTETDTGRVTLMDRRIITRRYGRALLDSLPPFRRELARQ